MTPTGQLVANAMTSVAEWEREVIAQRIRDRIAEAKVKGMHVGRLIRTPPQTIKRIGQPRATGRTLAAIFAGPQAHEMPTAHGGKRWYPTTAKAVLRITGAS